MPERNDQPAQPPTPTPCPTCNGAGGETITTSDAGVTRSTWHSCKACGGSGRRYS